MDEDTVWEVNSKTVSYSQKQHRLQQILAMMKSVD